MRITHLIISLIIVLGSAKALTLIPESRIYLQQTGNDLLIQTDKGSIISYDLTPYKINYKTGDIEKKITYNFQTINEGFGKVKYIEEITLDGTTNEIIEEFSEQPTSCQKYLYTEKKTELIKMCNYDEMCIKENGQKEYLICYWEKYNIWKDFSTYEINTKQYINVERTANGIKRTGLYGLKNVKFNDIIFTQRVLTMNGTTNCSEIINWYFQTNEGINCTNLNVSKYGGASPYNFTNQTTIVSLCSWKLKTGATTNWTTLNCTNEHFTIFKEGTEPWRVTGINVIFLSDYINYPIYVGNNVIIKLNDVTLQTESTKPLGNKYMLTFYETIKENISMSIEKSAIISRGGENYPDYFYPATTNFQTANATIKDSYFSKVEISSLHENPINYFNGTILMVNSQISLPMNISQSNDNYLSIISDTTPADICFSSPFFKKLSTSFKNTNLKCHKLSAGLLSALYLNLTDSKVELNDYSGGGYGHANNFQLKYTQTYYLNANMTINCSGDRPENKYNYYGNKMDYAFSYMLSSNSPTPSFTYFSAPLCNITDNSSTYMRVGEPNTQLNISEKHVGQMLVQRIPYQIQLNPNSQYVLKIE